MNSELVRSQPLRKLSVTAKVADTIETHATMVELYREFAKWCLAARQSTYRAFVHIQGVSQSKQDDRRFESYQDEASAGPCQWLPGISGSQCR